MVAGELAVVPGVGRQPGVEAAERRGEAPGAQPRVTVRVAVEVGEPDVVGEDDAAPPPQPAEGAEVVVDYVGQDTFARSVRCMRAGGRLVTCGASSGAEVTLDLRYVWVRELTLLGSDGWRRNDLDTLCELVREGRLAPVIHRVFPLSEVAAAVAEVEERRAFGKVLVEVG